MVTIARFFLLSRKEPARRFTDTLLDFLKVTATAIFRLASRHRLLNLPDTRPTTQHWQSVGQSFWSALIGQAGKIKHPVYIYIYTACFNAKGPEFIYIYTACLNVKRP